MMQIEINQRKENKLKKLRKIKRKQKEELGLQGTSARRKNLLFVMPLSGVVVARLMLGFFRDLISRSSN